MFGYSNLREELDLDYIRDFLCHHDLEKNTKTAALKRVVKEYAEYLRRLTDDETKELSKDSNILIETKLNISKEDFNYFVDLVQKVNDTRQSKIENEKTIFVLEVLPGYYLEKEDYVFGVSNSLLLTPDLTKAKIFENEEDIPDLNLMNVKIEKLFLRLKTNSLESEDFDLPKINIQENNKKEAVSSFDDEKWEKIDNLDEDKTDEGFKITGGLFGGNQDYGDQSDDEDE